MNVEFLSSLIKNYERDDLNIYISDSAARILACTDESRVGTWGNTANYICSLQHAASIQDMTSIHRADSHYGIPVLIAGSIQYIIVTYGNSEYTVQIGQILHAALQTTLDYQEYTKKKANRIPNELEETARLMLSANTDKEKLYTLMQHNNLEISIPRFVINILINLPFPDPDASAAEIEIAAKTFKNEVLQQLKKSNYFHAKDLFYSPEKNILIIIKSMQKEEKTEKLYQTMNEICKHCIDILNQIKELSYSIAYGNYYEIPEMIYQSWVEATEILELAKSSKATTVYNLDHILLDYISSLLIPNINKRYIHPAEKALIGNDSKVQFHLIDTTEAFIDNAFNLSATSEQMHMHRNTVSSYLKQFSALTGLYPSDSFQDAFLTKMLAISVRRYKYYHSTQQYTT